MKGLITKITFCSLFFSFLFVSCQKETTDLDPAVPQKVITKSEEVPLLTTLQKKQVPSAKITASTNQTTTLPLAAQSRASAGARALGCATLEIASNIQTGNSYNFYGFAGDDEFYHLDVTCPTTYVIDLFDLSADLDIFILRNNGGTLSMLDYSANYRTEAERIIVDLPVGSYAILVDAYAAGITSPYKITVKCFPSRELLAGCFFGSGGDFLTAHNAGDKIAEVSPAFLRFDPNQTDDPVVAGFRDNKSFTVTAGMDPILFIDRFVQDKEGLKETRHLKMRIPAGRNARLGIEKSEEDGIAGTALIDLESDGSIWIRVQGRWYRSSKRYTQGQWMDVQLSHSSELGEYIFSIDYEEIATLTSDLQVERTTSGSRGYAGISLMTFNSRSKYEVEEVYSTIVSPSGGSSRVRKREISIKVN